LIHGLYWIILDEYPLVMTNIAIEHGSFMVELPIKDGDFHSYVSLPEGIIYASFSCHVMLWWLGAQSDWAQSGSLAASAKGDRHLDDTGDLGESVTSEPGMALEKSCRENPLGFYGPPGIKCGSRKWGVEWEHPSVNGNFLLPCFITGGYIITPVGVSSEMSCWLFRNLISRIFQDSARQLEHVDPRDRKTTPGTASPACSEAGELVESSTASATWIETRQVVVLIKSELFF